MAGSEVRQRQVSTSQDTTAKAPAVGHKKSPPARYDLKSLCRMNLCIIGNILLLAPGVLLAKFGDSVIETQDLAGASAAGLVMILLLHSLFYRGMNDSYPFGRRLLCILATMLCSSAAAAFIVIHFGSFTAHPASTLRIIVAYAVANACLQLVCRLLGVKTSLTDFFPAP